MHTLTQECGSGRERELEGERGRERERKRKGERAQYISQNIHNKTWCDTNAKISTFPEYHNNSTAACHLSVQYDVFRSYCSVYIMSFWTLCFLSVFIRAASKPPCARFMWLSAVICRTFIPEYLLVNILRIYFWREYILLKVVAAVGKRARGNTKESRRKKDKYINM